MTLRIRVASNVHSISMMPVVTDRAMPYRNTQFLQATAGFHNNAFDFGSTAMVLLLSPQSGWVPTHHSVHSSHIPVVLGLTNLCICQYLVKPMATCNSDALCSSRVRFYCSIGCEGQCINPCWIIID